MKGLNVTGLEYSMNFFPKATPTNFILLRKCKLPRQELNIIFRFNQQRPKPALMIKNKTEGEIEFRMTRCKLLSKTIKLKSGENYYFNEIDHNIYCKAQKAGIVEVLTN